MLGFFILPCLLGVFISLLNNADTVHIALLAWGLYFLVEQCFQCWYCSKFCIKSLPLFVYNNTVSADVNYLVKHVLNALVNIRVTLPCKTALIVSVISSSTWFQANHRVALNIIVISAVYWYIVVVLSLCIHVGMTLVASLMASEKVRSNI